MAVWNIINKSDSIFFKRIDAERYKPEYFANEQFLKKSPYKKLKKYISEISGGATPKGANYPLFGVPFVRVQNIKDNFIDLSDVVYIDENIHNGELKRSQIKDGDVLLTITGVSYGNASTAYHEMLPANMNQHSVRIALNKTIIPEFLSTFLVTKYGRLQSDSRITGDTRPALTYNEINNYLIPTISLFDQLKIKEIVNKSLSEKIKSKKLYKQATDLLEKELGLDKINFEKPKSYSASFSEVATSRRMNAEYFSPLINDILKQPFLKNSKPLTQLFQIVRGSSPSKYYKEGIPVIKTKNIRLPEIDRERISDYVISTKDFTTIQESDLLLASMGVGSLGRMSYIFELEQDFVVDGTIRVLRKREETPANYEIPTLLFLSSKVGQELIYRGIVGSTGIISLPDEFLNKIPVPQFETKFCMKITELVKNSMLAKKQSQQLLSEAKVRVEQLIEQVANT